MKTKRRNISLPIQDDLLLHEMSDANNIAYSRLISMITHDWMERQRELYQISPVKASVFYTRYKESPTPNQ